METTNLTMYLFMAVGVLVAGFLVFLFGMWKRKKNEVLRITHIIGEFWPADGGERYKVLLEKKDNTNEVEAPAVGKHKIQTYLYDRASTTQTKYPSSPPLNIPLLSFMQVNMPMASWLENNPEPINPYKHKPVATAERIFNLVDDHFLSLATMASSEIKKLQEELIKALIAKINKWIVYGGLGFIAAEGLIIIALIYNALYGGLT